MLRKVVLAGFALAVTFTLASAEEFRASIVKVQDGKVSFYKMKKGEGKKGFGGEKDGPEVTLPTSANCKVVTTKFNKEDMKLETGDALPNGLKNERFQTIGERGVGATIITDTDGKTITEIRVFGQRKKKDV